MNQQIAFETCGLCGHEYMTDVDDRIVLFRRNTTEPVPTCLRCTEAALQLCKVPLQNQED